MNFKKKETNSDLCKQTADVVNELLNAAPSLHKLHLKVTGQGSYAAHKALQGYDKFQDFGDQLAEEYQGAAEEILTIIDTTPKTLNTVEEGLTFLKELKDKISSLQKVMPYSEIVNDLDTYKSEINGMKYKLLFLK